VVEFGRKLGVRHMSEINGHLEGFNRQHQLDGEQPDCTNYGVLSPVTKAGRTVTSRRSLSMSKSEIFGSQGHHQHHGGGSKLQLLCARSIERRWRERVGTGNRIKVVRHKVRGVAGTWKDLTGAVNSMAGQPHSPSMRQIVTAVANGA